MSMSRQDTEAPMPIRPDRAKTKDDGTPRHPGVASLLNELRQSHLPITEPDPTHVTAHVLVLAYRLADQLPEGPELTAGLRKLLEAEDCFLRAQRETK